MDTTAFCAIGTALAACVTDVQQRRIPNALTFGSAAVALLFHALAPGGHGFPSAATGWLAGAAMMFFPFALGGLGAGDVKLMAALGCWLGPLSAVWIAAYAAIAGGVLALAIAIR